VSSVKSGKPAGQPSASSYSRLDTSNFRRNTGCRRPIVPNKAKCGHPGASGERHAGWRANAPNKPNFGPGKMKVKCCTNKELRRVCCESGPGKTKPIRPGGGYRGSGFSDPRPGARTLDRLYKQTQFPGSRRGSLYKQTQFAPAGWADGTMAGAYCVKQSQSCETKPIRQAARRLGARCTNKANSVSGSIQSSAWREESYGE
jgi:hypothetical protein